MALGTVDNVKQLNQLTDAELQATFEVAARACGQELAVRMRTHASPSGVQLDAVADTLGMKPRPGGGATDPSASTAPTDPR